MTDPARPPRKAAAKKATKRPPQKKKAAAKKAPSRRVGLPGPFIVRRRDDRPIDASTWTALADALSATTDPDVADVADIADSFRFARTWRLRPGRGTYTRQDWPDGLGLADGEAATLGRDGLAAAWERALGWPHGGPTYAVADLFPTRPVEELTGDGPLTDEQRDAYGGAFWVGGSWTGQREDPDAVPLDGPPCGTEPADLWEAMGALVADPDDDCPVGTVRSLQPDEGRDFTRWSYYAAGDRYFDTDVGDGLDGVLAEPDAGLTRWAGGDIPRNDLLVGHFDGPVPCVEPGISLGGGLGMSLLDGNLRRFPVSEHPGLSLWHGPYPFDPLTDDLVVDDHHGCLTAPWLLALLVVVVLLVVGASLALRDSGGDEQVERPSPTADVTTSSHPADPPSFSTTDPLDLARVADGTADPDADPLAEIVGIEIQDLGDHYRVIITVTGGDRPIDEARRSHDSSAYEVSVQRSDGSTQSWLWELHLAALVDGEDRGDPAAPAATVTFTGDQIIFDLPVGPDSIERFGARSFSNPELLDGEAGPEFFDEVLFELGPAFSGGA